jgi:hypothetical protein
MVDLIPPYWLIKAAVASVWIYEGLWCKLLKGDTRQFGIVRSVPKYGPQFGAIFLRILGSVELLTAIWVLSNKHQVLCASFQTLLLFSLNLNGIIWSRKLIHDPAGMVVKNFAFLILAWVAASIPG